MTNLAEKACTACVSDAPKLTASQLDELRGQIPNWREVNDEGVPQLQREFSFADFMEAMSFANSVAELAESFNHHPKLQVEWGKTTVTWWTHKISGLHLNDAILAAKTDGLMAEKEKAKV